MATISPSAPTFTPIEGSASDGNATVLTTGNVGTLRTLDLKGKYGARLLVRMGRLASTALTRAAYIMVRSSDNDTMFHPSLFRDFVSQTAACIQNTLSSAASATATTIVLTSATGFNVGDTICITSPSSDGLRTEFNRIVAISTNTLTLERPLRLSHNSADLVTTLADCGEIFLPGQDIYEIRCINNSGQSIAFQVEAIVDQSQTVV